MNADGELIDRLLSCRRLSPWQRHFLRDVRGRELTPAQRTQLNTIRWLHLAPAANKRQARRKQRARAGIETVPCLVRECASNEEADMIWWESNLQRKMTTEQQARFYESRLVIEMALAKGRKSASGGDRKTENAKNPEKKAVGGNSPNRSDAGRAKDKAAEASGMSRKTAEAAAGVTKVIDQLIADGRTDDANRLRAMLEKSVSAAQKLAITFMAPKKPKPEPEQKPDAAPAADIVNDSLDRPVPVELRYSHSASQRIAALGRDIDKVIREMKEVAASAGGEVLAVHTDMITLNLKEAKKELVDCRYWTCCPHWQRVSAADRLRPQAVQSLASS